nr:hypothetical protein BaRGS_019329 [Batillaria attramentaria]
METIRNLRKEVKRALYKAGRLHTEDNRDDGGSDPDYRRHYTDEASSRSDDKYNHYYTGDDDYDNDNRGYDYNYRGYDYNHRGNNDYNYRGHDDYNYRGHDDYDCRRSDRHDYGGRRRGRVGSVRARGNNISTLGSGRVAVSQGDVKDNHTTDSTNMEWAIQDLLQRSGIQVMPWPALSPDMNPIEQFWDLLQTQLNRREQMLLAGSPMLDRSKDKPVKDKNGHPLTTTEEQLKRWAEHFRELLNRPIPETPPDIPPAETELPVNCDKPSKAEIRKAIMTLKNGKAAGPDQIPAEAIKADTETAVNMLHSLFSKIWEKEEVPAQWKEGIVIKL